MPIELKTIPFLLNPVLHRAFSRILREDLPFRLEIKSRDYATFPLKVIIISRFLQKEIRLCKLFDANLSLCLFFQI